MYIRVCTKPTRVHRLNANPVNEEEGGLSAGAVLDSAALSPILCCRICPCSASSVCLPLCPSKGPIPAAGSGSTRAGIRGILPHPPAEPKRSPGFWQRS